MASSRPMYKETVMTDIQDLMIKVFIVAFCVHRLLINSALIQGQCALSELTDTATSNPPYMILDSIALGSCIKALVISVDTHSETIFFSLNNDRLHPHQSHHVLGVSVDVHTHRPHPNVSMVPASPMHHWRSSSWFNHPSRRSLLIAPSPSSSPSLQKGRSFCERLREHPLFKNPEGQNIMARAFGISDRASLLPQPPVDSNDTYVNLRAVQNKEWAIDSVSRGGELARNSKLDDAIRYYTQALEIEPQCVDAYVGRGAAYMRLERLQDACKDLRHAVELDPEHANAIKFLQAAEEKVGFTHSYRFLITLILYAAERCLLLNGARSESSPPIKHS